MSDEPKFRCPSSTGNADVVPRIDESRSRRTAATIRAAPPTSKPCSTCRCRSRPCSAAPGWISATCCKLGPGAVLELDRKVGEAIDIYINNRLVARGEVVLVEEKLGVTMTEMIKAERN